MKKLILKIKDKAGKKLRSRAGESFAETMVALLISVLALTMLAGAISTASGIIIRSRTSIEDYQDNVEKVITEDSSDPAVITISGKVNISVTPAPIAGTVNLSITNQPVSCYGTQMGNTSVGIYKKGGE